MPFNSQSPFILKLNALFSIPRPRPLNSGILTGTTATLTERAVHHQLIPEAERPHVDAWPQDHQALLRGLFVVAIDENLPVSFAWEEAEATRTIVVSFGDKLGITFRSPYY
jgi:hypothetical protein